MTTNQAEYRVYRGRGFETEHGPDIALAPFDPWSAPLPARDLSGLRRLITHTAIHALTLDRLGSSEFLVIVQHEIGPDGYPVEYSPDEAIEHFIMFFKGATIVVRNDVTPPIDAALPSYTCIARKPW